MKKFRKFIRFSLLVCILGAIGYLSTLLIMPNLSEKQSVCLDVCIDGDTVWLMVDGVQHKCRLLLIDTPEIKPVEEPYGLEAKYYLESLLKNANTIEIKYQDNNEVKDKYDRDLIWLFVDGKLVQTTMCEMGYVKSIYDNGGPYDYIDEVFEAYLQAKENKVGLNSLSD